MMAVGDELTAAAGLTCGYVALALNCGAVDVRMAGRRTGCENYILFAGVLYV